MAGWYNSRTGLLVKLAHISGQLPAQFCDDVYGRGGPALKGVVCHWQKGEAFRRASVIVLFRL